jgi:hypothetical protein
MILTAIFAQSNRTTSCRRGPKESDIEPAQVVAIPRPGPRGAVRQGSPVPAAVGPVSPVPAAFRRVACPRIRRVACPRRLCPRRLVIDPRCHGVRCSGRSVGPPHRPSLRRSHRPSETIVRNPFSDPSRWKENPPFCGFGGQFADCADRAGASVTERATGVQFDGKRAPYRAIHDPRIDWLSHFLPRGEVGSFGQVRPISGAGFVRVLPLSLEDPPRRSYVACPRKISGSSWRG